MPIEKLDTKTGHRWRLIKKVYETVWFEALALILCVLIAWGLLNLLTSVWLNTNGAEEGVRHLTLAQSLVNGYGLSWLASDGSHIVDTTTPPTYPLLMATVMTLTGTHAVADAFEPILWLNLSLYVMSLWLMYRFSGRHCRKPYPLIMTLLFGLAPVTLMSIGQMSATLPYLVLSLLVLNILDKRLAEVGNPRMNKWSIALLLLGLGVSITTNAAGWALLGATIMVLMRHYGVQKSLTALALVVVLVAPWLVRNWIYNEHPNVAPPVAVSQSMSVDHVHEVVHATTANILLAQPWAEQRTSGNVTRSPMLDFGFDQWLILQIIILSLLGIGLLTGLYSASGAGAVYLLFHLALMTLSSGTDAFNTLSLVPVFPVLMVYVFQGLLKLCDWARPHHLKVAAITSGVLITFLVLNSVGIYVEDVRISSSSVTQKFFNQVSTPVSLANYTEKRSDVKQPVGPKVTQSQKNLPNPVAVVASQAVPPAPPPAAQATSQPTVQAQPVAVTAQAQKPAASSTAPTPVAQSSPSDTADGYSAVAVQERQSSKKTIATTVPVPIPTPEAAPDSQSLSFNQTNSAISVPEDAVGTISFPTP